MLVSILINLFFLLQSGVEMADALRSSGKIYVVVAVLGAILLGVFIFLFLLEKRISKLEKETGG